jgi:glycosyltransferase involved in cell wall biosynthesis
MIKISIVTITYNASAVLRRTLDSVKNQAYQYIEHLIVDGASTDDTVEIAIDYKEEIRLFFLNDIFGKNRRVCKLMIAERVAEELLKILLQ